MDADPWVIWICDRCAKVKGGSFYEGHLATFHEGQCDVCFCHTVVTEPRDYRLWGLKKPRNHPDIRMNACNQNAELSMDIPTYTQN